MFGSLVRTNPALRRLVPVLHLIGRVLVVLPCESSLTALTHQRSCTNHATPAAEGWFAACSGFPAPATVAGSTHLAPVGPPDWHQTHPGSRRPAPVAAGSRTGRRRGPARTGGAPPP